MRNSVSPLFPPPEPARSGQLEGARSGRLREGHVPSPRSESTRRSIRVARRRNRSIPRRRAHKRRARKSDAPASHANLPHLLCRAAPHTARRSRSDLSESRLRPARPASRAVRRRRRCRCRRNRSVRAGPRRPATGGHRRGRAALSGAGLRRRNGGLRRNPRGGPKSPAPEESAVWPALCFRPRRYGDYAVVAVRRRREGAAGPRGVSHQAVAAACSSSSRLSPPPCRMHVPSASLSPNLLPAAGLLLRGRRLRERTKMTSRPRPPPSLRPGHASRARAVPSALSS
jgi:hypothetical protein